MHLFALLRRRIFPTPAQEAADPTDWRERVLFTILAVVMVFGTATAAPSIWLALRDGLYVVVAVDLVALAMAATLTFHPRIPFRSRACGLLGVTYVLGVFFLFHVGLVSQLYLMAVPILAALLLGLRPAIIALAVNTLTLGVVGFIAAPDLGLGDRISDPVVHWLLVSINFLFVDAVITISAAVVLRRLERSLVREERAAASLARLARGLEQAKEGIIIADRGGAVVYANHSASEMTAMIADEPSRHWLQDLPADDAALVDALTAGREWRGAIQRHRSDGTRQQLDATVTPVMSDAQRLDSFVAVLRDVTHERAMEERLRRGQKLEAVGTLSGGIAHDFNNIIGSILAVAELERDSAAPGSDTSAVNQIILACNRARDIVRKMMEFSRQTVAVRSPICLADAAAEALPLLRASIPSTVSIESHFESTSLVSVDPSEVHQILMNLGTNAAHAMRANGGVLRFSSSDVVADVALVAAAPRLKAGVRYVRLEVTDTGHGIRPEHLERIFDPFFSTKHPTEGTGLGLASVHGIVRSLEGEINVFSVVGLGTTFQIHLPTAEAPERPRAITPVNTSPSKWGRGLSVMVVDDEPALREAQRRALERVGFTVVTAEDGREALALLGSAQRPVVDLLITDLSMPEVGGLELIRGSRVTHPDLRVLLTSGFAMTRHHEELVAIRADAFLQKPYGLDELLRTTREVLERSTIGGGSPTGSP